MSPPLAPPIEDGITVSNQLSPQPPALSRYLRFVEHLPSHRLNLPGASDTQRTNRRRGPFAVTGHEYGLIVATVLLTDSAFTNLRDWLESDDGRAWQRRNRASPAAGARTSDALVVGLVVAAVREIAAAFDEIPPERPGSLWKLATAAADEGTGLTIHLRIGDAGDLDLLVDRALIVLGFRLEIRDPP